MSAAVSLRELTTVLTTTMTTVGLPDTSTYTTIEIVSCLVPTDQKIRVRDSLRAHPLAPPGNHCGLPALSRRGWVTGRRVSAVSPLIVRTPLRSGRHHQRRSMTDAVPAAVLLATTVLPGRVDGDGVGSPLGRNNSLCTGSGVDGDHGVVERLPT